MQHLKLSDAQAEEIKSLHNKMQVDVSYISMMDVKDGALILVIQSSQWDEAAVKKQIAASSKIQE